MQDMNDVNGLAATFDESVASPLFFLHVRHRVMIPHLRRSRSQQRTRRVSRLELAPWTIRLEHKSVDRNGSRHTHVQLRAKRAPVQPNCHASHTEQVVEIRARSGEAVARCTVREQLLAGG